MIKLLFIFTLFLNTQTFAQDDLSPIESIPEAALEPTKLENSLMEVFQNSGLETQYQELFRYLIEKKQHFYYFPKGLFAIRDIKEKVLNYVGKALTPDEIFQLKTKFQNIFLSKISKLAAAPITDLKKYNNYIKKYGKKADKQKVDLLSKVVNIIDTDPYLLKTKLMLVKAIEIQILRRKEAYNNNSISELSNTADKTALKDLNLLKVDQPIYQARSMYFKNRYTTNSELKQFIRIYGEDSLVKKLFKIHAEAMATYTKLAFDALTDDKKLTKKIN